MATQNLSPALCAPASSRPYPMAKPGYGKRSVPDQSPRRDDFMLLPERERYIARYVDHLPDGAAMNVKSLAKDLPRYGQQAVGSALTALSVAGHLRRVRRPAGEGEQVRWVFRTFWSRTARDNEWWAAFLAAEDSKAVPEAASTTTVAPPPWVPADPPAPLPAGTIAADAPLPAPEPVAPPQPAAEPVRVPAVPPRPIPYPHCLSPAYLALAQLGRTEPRLALSAADCSVLEELAAAWLARGVNTDYLIHALTSGLPAAVGSPVGFVRRRLLDKIPPSLPAAPAPAAPGAPERRLMVECTECGAPGRPEALPDGLCLPCRQATHGTAAAPIEPAIERNIQAHMSNLRSLLKAP
ncbi:MarR family transcriptional regulator [Streptomyces sp. NBC_01221]|uniref:MarR family transcriptional regulator n=1 Tax=unclassified Streptomyces TaxID=2593676 RepID=UPI00224FCC99|nr:MULTISPECIES: MarR family transcriptional regulator [unclassified Streptomyces]MCX4788064.1 MarR family transcriptional regulator [Streptomyces sp. NBC_01221]MCX4796175.1 MarR family transcriptional regulator [Streptomyces sp. NBC_01242]WSP56339.1 MarR family transcriptional regulator [Streptomyces sp. NBC_01241]